MSKEENKKLCEEFPFLIPVNVWSGKRIIDCCGPNGENGYWPGDPESHPEYDYEYTLFDNIPEGWRKAFGLDMCREIKEDLIENNYLDDYMIVQIKEKYGTLRWYDNGGSKKHREIINKYEHKSSRTCIECGAPAEWISRDWISPFCDKCATESYNHYNNSYSSQTPWEEYFIDINEYY